MKYFNDYVSRNIRPDGRKFHDQRNVRLNVDALKTADSSAIVKCGNTTVVCGIKLVSNKEWRWNLLMTQLTHVSLLQELATPKADEPDQGFLITNVELPPLCSSRFRPGPPSDHAQVTSTIVSEIITSSKCVDLKDLCIVHDKLVWVLYCDMVCLDNDGSLVDACIMTLMACLKTCKYLIYSPFT